MISQAQLLQTTIPCSVVVPYEASPLSIRIIFYLAAAALAGTPDGDLCASIVFVQ